MSKDELAAANGLESQASGLIQIIGAATGGVLAATIGPISCFSINAASYLWSAWYVLRCHWVEQDSMVDNGVGYFQALRAGFREALHNRMVCSIILIGISWGLAGGGYYILIPVLGQQVYHMGGLGIGILYVIDGAGVLVGAYAVDRYVGKQHRRAVIWYGVAYLTQALFFGVMTQFTVFAWGALMLLLMRISSGAIIPLDTYMLQTSTNPDVQGRVFALHGPTYGGVMQLSFAIMGWAISRFGIPATGLAPHLATFPMVKCTNCGREQQWTTSVDVGIADIQLAGFTVYCVCGHVVTEEEGTILREIQIDVNRTCPRDSQPSS